MDEAKVVGSAVLFPADKSAACFLIQVCFSLILAKFLHFVIKNKPYGYRYLMITTLLHLISTRDADEALGWTPRWQPPSSLGL